MTRVGLVLSRQEYSLYHRTFGNHYFLIALTFSLIFILVGVLSDHLEREFDRIEKVQFDYRLSELKAAVRLMEAELVSQGNMQSADVYEGKNPVDWLEDDLSHYLGVIEPSKAIHHPGYWFFDQYAQAISFVPNIKTGADEEDDKVESLDKILRFKVRTLRSKDIKKKYSGLILEQITTQSIHQ